MNATDKAIGMALARLSVVLAMAFGIYAIAGRLMDLSASSANSESVMAGTPSASKAMPRLPSDAEMNRMNALSTRIDVLSNNLANAETEGFKRQRLMVSSGVDGAISLSTQLDMTQGRLESTGNPTDVAIEGDGLLKIRVQPTVGDGTAYTRVGSLFRNKNGDLVVGIGEGYPLIPNINIPLGATSVSIAQDGTVQYVPKGGNQAVSAGQINLCTFMNPQAMCRLGGCIYTETNESGPPIQGTPGENGSGQLMQGFLEASNVDKLKEQVALLKAEESLERGTQSIRTVANIMQLATAYKK